MQNIRVYLPCPLSNPIVRLWSPLKTIPDRPMVWLIHHFILHPMFGFSDGIVPSHKSHLIGGCFAIHVLVLEHTVAFG